MSVVVRPQELPEAHRARVVAQLAGVLGTSSAALERDIAEGEKLSGVEPIVVAEDVDPVVQATIEERYREIPGVSLERTYIREYPLGETAAHLVGYVQPIPREKEQEYLRRGYRRTEAVGVAGIERQYEQYLRGIAGTRRYEVDATGDLTDRGNIGRVDPRPGKNVRLSLDLPTQRALEEQLRVRVLTTSAPAAAGVALDPGTGEVLALASYPAYDPSVFDGAPRTARRRARLVTGAGGTRPLLNRAIEGQYPPASTFKAITAIAGLEEEYFTADEEIAAPAEQRYYDTIFRNFGSENLGVQQLTGALKWSADTYFYEIGDRLWQGFLGRNLNHLQEWSRRFGFGKPTGIDIPGEQGGRVPDEAWKREWYKDDPTNNFWKPGDVINMSVGQGDLLVTPLQMAVAYAAIANGGTVWRPTLVRTVESPEGSKLVSPGRSRASRPLEASEANLDAVQDGLYLVANNGDGTASGVFGLLPDAVKVAGKTGTAENTVAGRPAPDHSWFVGYAPFDSPRVVVAIVVENGGQGANAAAPAVCQVIAANLKFDPDSCGTSARAN
jgi:penicillin-binding protein 2